MVGQKPVLKPRSTSCAAPIALVRSRVGRSAVVGIVGSLMVVGCGDAFGASSGPTFKGVVTLDDVPIVGVRVTATASTCSGPFLAEGQGATDGQGNYSLVVPMALGASNVCLKIIAEGTVAQVSISGFAYRTEGQELIVDLDERRRVIILRPDG